MFIYRERQSEADMDIIGIITSGRETVLRQNCAPSNGTLLVQFFCTVCDDHDKQVRNYQLALHLLLYILLTRFIYKIEVSFVL